MARLNDLHDEYARAERAFNAIVGKISVPATEQQVAVARRYVEASKHRHHHPRHAA
jgi:hypothetical protein